MWRERQSKRWLSDKKGKATNAYGMVNSHHLASGQKKIEKAAWAWEDHYHIRGYLSSQPTRPTAAAVELCVCADRMSLVRPPHLHRHWKQQFSSIQTQVRGIKTTKNIHQQTGRETDAAALHVPYWVRLGYFARKASVFSMPFSIAGGSAMVFA